MVELAPLYPSSVPDAAAVRIFARLFPGVTLLATSVSRRYLCLTDTWVPDRWMSFEGPEQLVLEYGLVERTMLPPKPKRVRHEYYGPEDAREFVSVHRRAGLLKVRRELYEWLPRTHPLAPFGPWHLQLIDSPRSYLRLVVDNTR